MPRFSHDNRRAALRGLDIATGTGLEIGPLNRPLVDRAQGRVFYADHLSTEKLKEKYADDPEVDVTGIVSVDFDLSTGRLPEVAAASAPFDYVVASHVAEHVPDLVGWLTDVAAVLRPGGVLALVLPDRRFTLDLHRRETPFQDVEAAHEEGRTRPSLETVLDHFLNIVEADARALWRDPDAGRDAPRVMPPGIVEGVTEHWQTGAYMDAHCWVVTPWSFLRLVGRIVERYGLNYRLHWAAPTPFDQLEFYVQLEKRTPDAPATDWTLAAAALQRRAALLNENGAARRLRSGWRRLTRFSRRVG